MLTPAQYKALKSWPDGYLAEIRSAGNGFRVYCGLIHLGTSRVLEYMIRRGLVYRHNSYQYGKFVHLCNDAIREYEEAQSKTTKERTMELKTSWQWGDKGKVAKAAGLRASNFCAILYGHSACSADTAVRLEAACLAYGYDIPKDQWVFIEHRSGNPLFPTRKGGKE